MSTTTYAYDLSGNIVQKTLGNGLKEVRTHDGRNRVSTLDNQTGGGTDIAGYAYHYDRAGNVMQVVEDYPAGDLLGRTITNSYDGVHRLTQEKIVTTGGSTVTTTYAYDQGHNRTSKAISGGATTTYVIGNGSNGAGANQIVSETTSGTATNYAYDNNGNRSTRTLGVHTDIYTYDDENRLISLAYQTGGSGTGTYTYAYDYRTRRVTRTEPGPATTHIVFDGGVSIEEFTSSPSSPTVEYVRGHDYGGGVGGLEYSVRSGTPSFNFYDSRGDVTTQTSSTGSVTFQTAYEAFGNQTVTDGSTPDRQKASTKEQDPTGLLNEGFRYRDTLTGTFLTRDPLGFKAGPNMYTYVRQNPWTHFDPEGLDDNKQPNPPPPPPPKTESPRVGSINGGPTAGNIGSVTGGDSSGRIGSVTGGSTGGATGSATIGQGGPYSQIGSVSGGPTGGNIGSVSGGSTGGNIGSVTGGPTGGNIGSIAFGTGGPFSRIGFIGFPIASARSSASRAGQLQLPGLKDDRDLKPGQVKLSHYGYPADATPDTRTQKKLGNRGNTLNDNSVAVSASEAQAAGLKNGDPIYYQGHFIGYYDDAVPPSYTNKKGQTRSLPPTVDIYDPHGLLGNNEAFSRTLNGSGISNHP